MCLWFDSAFFLAFTISHSSSIDIVHDWSHAFPSAKEKLLNI